MTPQSVEEYVDRQIRTWQEQSRSIDREQIRLPGHVWGPVIAVSREHGALGAQLKSALPGLDLQRIRVTVEESPGQSAWVERNYP